jgi:hypothetical protein
MNVILTMQGGIINVGKIPLRKIHHVRSLSFGLEPNLIGYYAFLQLKQEGIEEI